MIEILMMSGKFATSVSLKHSYEVKRYDVIISVHDITNKILSPESDYMEDVVMRPK